MRLAEVKDIAAMKIAAIIEWGTKKDFIDIYFLLKIYSLKEIFKFYSAKYPDSSLFIALKRVVFHRVCPEPVPRTL